jgi:hypothetical protein
VDFGQGWEFEKFDRVGQRGFFVGIIGLRDGIGEFGNRVAAAELDGGFECGFTNFRVAIVEFGEDDIEIGTVVSHGDVHEFSRAFLDEGLMGVFG